MNTQACINDEAININDANSARDQKRRRRSKHETEGRIYKCHCGKSYLSQPALNNHASNKHGFTGPGLEKRGRGRPRKYPIDSEQSKFEKFFFISPRKKIDGENFSLNEILRLVFDDIYVKYSEQCYIRPKHYTDNHVLQMLFNDQQITTEKSKRSSDEVFYEYLKFVMEQTNKDYFLLIVKFAILFRECLNLSKRNETEVSNGGSIINISFDKVEFSRTGSAESLPELCNEFVSEFLENNNYFGIQSDSERNEIIELIQHFCSWLFKNEYTKSKLTLSS